MKLRAIASGWLLGAVRRPGFWLGLQLVCVTLLASQTGALDHQRVPDTQSYLNAAHSSSLDEALSRYRTYGYPLFLRLFESAGEIVVARVPRAHLIVYLVAIVVFARAAGRFLGSPWLALAAASPLAYAPIMSELPKLQPDFLAAACMILAVSFLMLLVERRTVPCWLGLTLAVFASYQLRPAGIFMIGFVPLCGWLFLWLRDRAAVGEARRFGVLLAVVTVGPFLAFASVRWVITGHFGLVSFGGFNVAGVATCFLDGNLAEELPEQDRRLARRVAMLRDKRAFKPLHRDGDPEAWFYQFSDNIFHVTLPIVKTHMRQEIGGPDAQLEEIELPVDWAVEANRRLSRLSEGILRRRPGLYVAWVRSALRYGLRQLPEWPWIGFPGLLLIVSAPLAVLRLAARDAPVADPELAARVRSLACLALAACGFFVVYLVEVSAVAFPFRRYFLSMILFLPSALTPLILECWWLIAATSDEER